MIAMQYSFTLPADYDMAIIERRIAEKGPLLDGFPNLKFKAYLSARREGDGMGSRENLYAPFYVWENGDGLSDFLCGPVFASLTQSFGWPTVRTWVVWRAHLSEKVSRATFATRDLLVTPPFTALDELRRRESDAALEDVQKRDALASVAAFEPTTWTRVRFRLWGDDRAAVVGEGTQAYRVGHLSLPLRH
jgi:hypothetical protein